jgi:transposase-like protein
MSSELMSKIEDVARLHKVTVSSILNQAVREWLKKNRSETSGAKAQRKLHAAAEKCIGVLSGLTPGRAETVRETVRRRVRERILRSQKKADSSLRSE